MNILDLIRDDINKVDGFYSYMFGSPDNYCINVKFLNQKVAVIWIEGGDFVIEFDRRRIIDIGGYVVRWFHRIPMVNYTDAELINILEEPFSALYNTKNCG